MPTPPIAFRTPASDGAGPRCVDLVGTLAARGVDPESVPYAARAVLDNLLRQSVLGLCEDDRLETLLRWHDAPADTAMPLAVSRVVMPDSSGVPLLADLAALRDVAACAGRDPADVRFAVPAHLVVDHSLQVDVAGTPDASARNLDAEFARNDERYRFLKWAMQAFDGIRVTPPGTGIIHQIHLERLASPIVRDPRHAAPTFGTELVVGTDSHTPMINGIGVLGWGVGGIEAETVLMGEPLIVPKPRCVGVRLAGSPRPGVLATDIALAVTQALRRDAPVGAFIEFVGEGVDRLSVPDRATIANMAPEYGATIGYFPVDAAAIEFLRSTGRAATDVDRVARVARSLGLYRERGDRLPDYDLALTVDLAAIEPAMAGPRRPESRVVLSQVPAAFAAALARPASNDGYGADAAAAADVDFEGRRVTLRHGFVAIAAITSCTITSNPAAMIAAGLLARNAVARGLSAAPWVKTSFAPGSRTVPRYLASLGLLEPLAAIGFSVVGYGCTTCGGKSGPLDPRVAGAIESRGLVACAVLSGNRNFEGRVHRLVRAAWLASPPLVVASAIAGRIDVDLDRDTLGVDAAGRAVRYADIAPDPAEVAALAGGVLAPSLFESAYAGADAGPEPWLRLPAQSGPRYAFDPASSYLVRPPFFDLPFEPPGDAIRDARALGVYGDSLNTDHISPGGEIPADSAAGRYLASLGVAQARFNTYVARRGNPEVMRRATFAHHRCANTMAPDRPGGWTRLLPGGGIVPVHEAAERYRERGVPLVVLAGRHYGSGSSRDWAAKGPMLLGVRAVIAASFERIHRSNLVGMGILPLAHAAGEDWRALGLDGTEVYDIEGIAAALADGAPVRVRARGAGREVTFETRAAGHTAAEARLLREGGIFRAARRRWTAPAATNDGVAA